MKLVCSYINILVTRFENWYNLRYFHAIWKITFLKRFSTNICQWLNNVINNFHYINTYSICVHGFSIFKFVYNFKTSCSVQYLRYIELLQSVYK